MQVHAGIVRRKDGAEPAETDTTGGADASIWSLIPGSSTIWIDDFRRGPRREDVEKMPSPGSG